MFPKGVLGLWCLLSALPASFAVDKRPNIVFILTDDQDAHMSGLEHMPLTRTYLQDKGTSFERHYCTVSICCPSRVNIWTGQLSHNTNVTAVRPPYGGYPKFIQNGYNDKHLAYWLQQSGYNTYYTGKMYNGQTTTNYDKPAIKGYNESDLLLDPLTYQYYDFAATRNAGPVRNVSGEYSPDFTAKTAYEFLDLALGDDGNSARRPFFLTIAPIAPHCEGSGPTGKPPQAADRHKDLYKDYHIPRNTSNFNPDSPSGVSWVRDLDQMNDTVVEINDEYQRQRLRSLQSVDEMVEQVVLRLEEAGFLDNTHIFYTSDNGYHIGQHRLHPGKMLGFEEDIRVPLVWRGPGVPEGYTRQYATSHSDLAPTIMGIAGLSYDDREFDGAPLELEETTSRREHVGIEFWGRALAESTWSIGVGGYNGKYPENTYKGLRIEAEKYGLYYSVWCTQESELYDMKRDPGQMNNLLATHPENDAPRTSTIMPRPLQRVVDRLDALTLVLKSCKGYTCTHPWRALHPDGDVGSLLDAMDSRYDDFYAGQPKVSFDECAPGYIIGVEGPQEHNVYHGGGQELRRKAAEDDAWSWL